MLEEVNRQHPLRIQKNRLLVNALQSSRCTGLEKALDTFRSVDEWLRIIDHVLSRALFVRPDSGDWHPSLTGFYVPPFRRRGNGEA